MPSPADRLDALESIEAIKQLKSLYCAHCDDAYNGPAIAGLFTEDGVWENDELGRYEGRAAISAYFDGIKADLTFAAHLVLNPQVTMTGTDTARGTWRLLMPCTWERGVPPEARWMLCSYDNQFRREGGRWFFSELQARTQFFAPHLNGWVDRDAA